MTIEHTLVDKTIFIWFGTMMTVGMCLGWGTRDAVLLARFLRQDEAAPDEIFGSIMGLVISIIGIFGLLKYHLGF